MQYRVKNTHIVQDFVLNKGLIVDVTEIGNESVTTKFIMAGTFPKKEVTVKIDYDTFKQNYEKIVKNNGNGNGRESLRSTQNKSKPKINKNFVQKKKRPASVTVHREIENWEPLPQGFRLVNNENHCSCMGKKPCWQYNRRLCVHEKKMENNK